MSHPPSEKRELSMKMLREVEYLGVMRGSEVKDDEWSDD